MEEKNVKSSGLFFKVIIVLILLVVAYFSWKTYDQKKSGSVTGNQAPAAQGTPDKATQAEIDKATEELVAKVGKLILLPNEKPTLATVLDAKKLVAEQPFYAGAENGDQLLVYAKAQKAILYSPSKNILINVGPVYFNNATDTPATTKK